MREKYKPLTKAEWKLHDLLLEAGRKMTTQEIIEALPDEFGKYKKFGNDHDDSIAIRLAVRRLTESPETEKIFGYDDDYNFYACTCEEEAEAISESYHESALKKLRTYARIKRKAKKNGYGKCISTKCDPITENSKARRFVETYAGD